MTDTTLNNSGIRLAASVFGEANRAPILFLHGMSLSRDTWHELADRLRTKYQIWTLDFRGHGHSDRAPSYTLHDYLSDAKAALEEIGRPAVIVGHSLGGCVAGVLAQRGDPNVRAIFLEDPPWYLGQPGEWDRSIFPRLFSGVATQQATWQREGARLETYLAFVSNSPSPMGGRGKDHISPRHLLSHASALQRQDNRCWDEGWLTTSPFSPISVDQQFQCPAKILQADPKFGAALLSGHEVRLAACNPGAEVVRYHGGGHNLHRALAFEQRFAVDLEHFLSTVT